MHSDNPIGADNQQETISAMGSSETARWALKGERHPSAKRQSDLHGDMQSQAEMTWPRPEALGRSNRMPKVAKFLVG